MRFQFGSLAVLLLLTTLSCNVATATSAIPDPIVDAQLAAKSGEKTAVVAGGCFWGIQAVFQHVRGVIDAKSGYCGGSADTADYETVSSGRTLHAESVKITYDPSQITYGQLLKVFFSVAHDPTELNRQGPDVGTQYRSVIFCYDDEQKRIARAYVDQLNKAKVFKRSVVTELAGDSPFYQAEAYHQDYVVHHPDQPYIVYNDLPKLAALRKQLPALYVER